MGKQTNDCLLLWENVLLDITILVEWNMLIFFPFIYLTYINRQSSAWIFDRVRYLSIIWWGFANHLGLCISIASANSCKGLVKYSSCSDFISVCHFSNPLSGMVAVLQLSGKAAPFEVKATEISWVVCL